MNDKAKQQFDSLGLDHRLVKALLQSGFIKPTNVQMKSIPIALQKKDIMMRAKTGSGKTLAYCLPLMENIIRSLSASNNNTNNVIKTGPKALILAPTQELIHQINDVISSLILFCNDILRHLALTQHGKYTLINEKPRLMENPHILICTPSRLLSHLEKGHLSLTNVEHIILDEADLMITHDFENDIKKIVLHLPSNKNRAQIVMCSATLNPNTIKLQQLFLMHHPTIIDIDGSDGNGFNESKLTEYFFETNDFNDKFLVMYALLKLHIINGKCIVFVHNIDLSYRLKLFLEKFLIPTAVLNPKLPYNSRQSVIDKFNRGLFTYLITTDAISEHDDKFNIKNYWKMSKNTEEPQETNDNKEDKEEEKKQEDKDDDEDEDTEMQDNDNNNDNEDNNNDNEYDFEEEPQEENPYSSKKQQKRNEIGLLANKGLIAYRGVDFREVAAVINFSAPYSLKKYIHRVGRTARAGNYGVAITLVTPREMRKFRHILYQRVNNEQQSVIEKLPLSIQDLDSFRYRCDSVRCNITQKLVKQARLNELRMEILNSKRLQSHFKERKREFELLRHDKMLQPAEMVKPHMSHIPSYMLKNTELAAKPKELRKNNRYRDSVKEYQATFGQLPSLMKEQMRKKRLRKAMQRNPGLRKHVYARRRFNLRHPKKSFNTQLLKNWGFLDKTTLLDRHKRIKLVEDIRVYKKPVKGWKNPLKNPLVKLGRRKPSMRGLAKSQIKKIKKRRKMKKLAKRRK